MSSGLTLVRLALLELWTSFRLLAALAALGASGCVALLAIGLQPSTPLGPTIASAAPIAGWYATALAIATAVTAALVANAVAAERTRGFSGWLVSRTAPRSSLAVAWFAAGGLLVIGGGALSALIAWLALTAGPDTRPSDLPAFMAATAACLAAGLAAVAVAVAVGATVPPLPAFVATGIAVAAWLVGAALLSPDAAPGGGFAALAAFHATTRPVATGLESAGATLGIAAAALVGALASFGRVDL